jgi:5,6-dimethylbenzimidazole synthase
MQFNPATAAMLDELMRWRRDVRHFRTEAVPDAVLARLRQAMELAPSVGNARPWRVVRVQSPALRAAVRAEFVRCNAEAGEIYQGEQAAAYARLKLSGLDKAPVQLAVFTDLTPEAGHGLGCQTIPATLEQSTAMAVHTLWLAARAENLGVGMVSILDPAAIEALCSVPACWRFAAYLCVGWPAFDDDTPLLDRADWQKNTLSPWEIR